MARIVLPRHAVHVEAAPAVIEFLEADEPVHVLLSAVGVLGGMGAVEAIPALAKALDHPYESVREEAVKALGRIGHSSARPALRREMERAGDRRRICAAAAALARTGDRSVIPILRDGIRRGKTDGTAAEALAGMGIEGATQLLEVVEEFGWAGGLAEPLGMTGDPRVYPHIAALLGNRSAYIREDAALGLGRLGDPRTVECLLEAVDDRDDDVAYAACWALQRITGEEFGADGPSPRIYLHSLRRSRAAVRAWASR